MNCDELFLNEVCHVELVSAANCNLAVPANADPQTEMSGTYTDGGVTKDRIGQAAMVVDVNEVEDYAGVLDSAPSLKTSLKTQALSLSLEFSIKAIPLHRILN